MELLWQRYSSIMERVSLEERRFSSMTNSFSLWFMFQSSSKA